MTKVSFPRIIEGVLGFETVQALKDSTAPSRGTGSIWEAQGFRYEEKPAGTAKGGAGGYHIATAGGALLRALPGDDGVYNFACLAPSSASTAEPDTYDKFMMLLDCGIVGTGYYQSSAPIYIPNGKYYFSQGIELKRSVRIFGNHGGLPYTSAAELVFPTDSLGITVNRYNTLNGGVEATPTTAADGSVIEGLNITSTCGSDKTKHGIWLRARAVIRNVSVDGFSGNGINIVATAIASGAEHGNANNWVCDVVRITNCGGHGLYADGADANSGTGTCLDASNNGRTGIYDSSFLGNTYIGCHVANNGTAGKGNNASDQSSFVSYGGDRYAAHWDATEAQLVATTPGTDDSVWVSAGAGGTHSQIPLWTAGKPEGTYFRAFGYWADNHNARNVFLGCYWESGSSGNVFDSGPTVVLGGSIGWVMAGDYLRATSAGETTFNSVGTDGGTIQCRMGGADNTVIKFSHAEDNPAWPWRLERTGGDFSFRNAGVSSRTPFTLTGENTTLNFGTASPKPYIVSLGQFGMGFGSNARRQTTGTAAPTSGEYAKGDLIWSASASAGGKGGWICTTTGVAGSTAVFKPFAAIDA